MRPPASGVDFFADPATGLQLNGKRWYDPGAGTWLSEDPSGLGPDVNPYRYCGNSPTNGTDPSGEYDHADDSASIRNQCLAELQLIPSAPSNDRVGQTTGWEDMDADDDGPSDYGVYDFDEVPCGRFITMGVGQGWSGGYWHNVGEMLKGEFWDFPTSVAIGYLQDQLDNAIDPIGHGTRCAERMLNMALHPIGTGQACWNGLLKKFETPRGTGQVAMPVAIALGSLGASAWEGLAAGGEAAEAVEGDAAVAPEVGPSESMQQVYRGLAEGEDPALGLSARAPGAGNSVVSHIAGKQASQWISTSTDQAIATTRFGENGVVQIDLSKVTTEIVDVSDGIPGMEGTMLSNWAAKMKEVLIKDYIPPEAVTPVE